MSESRRNISFSTLLALTALSISLIASGCSKKGEEAQEETRSPVELGGELFTAMGCIDCHRVERPTDLEGETIEARLKRLGPDLWYAGSKFKKGFISGWLENPTKIRPLKFNSVEESSEGGHMAMTAREGGDVEAYLMTLTSPDVQAGVVEAEPNRKAFRLFSNRYACYACHRFTPGETELGGFTGPSLVGAGERLNPDWTYAFLSTPRAFEYVSPMPVFAGAINAKHMRYLSSYVGTLK